MCVRERECVCVRACMRACMYVIFLTTLYQPDRSSRTDLSLSNSDGLCTRLMSRVNAWTHADCYRDLMEIKGSIDAHHRVTAKYIYRGKEVSV